MSIISFTYVFKISFEEVGLGSIKILFLKKKRILNNSSFNKFILEIFEKRVHGI